MHRTEWLPPLPPAWDAEAKIVARVAVSVALWAAGAALLAQCRDDLPSAAWLFAIALVAAAAYIARRWRPTVSSSPPTFGAMWRSWRGLGRIAAFVAAFLLLSAVAGLGGSARW